MVSLPARVHCGLRLFCLLLVGAVVFSVLSGSPRPLVGGPDPVVPITEAADEATAMAAARAQGSRVEVARLRTPTQAVYANPGGTMTAEFSVLPTRVQRDGQWAPVDTSVVRRADGTVGPRATPSDLSLSGGGAKAPLVRMAQDGESIALHWPGTLPKPRLDKATATYPDVLPGVDLVMHVDPTGYRQHFVVRTPEAARNPDLARLEFRLETVGLRVSVDKAGAVRALDADGKVVFRAPPSVMWDSSGPAPANPDTARSAAVGVSLEAGALVLRPDLSFLTDPTVTFPVTIDPDMETTNKRNWATVLSGKPATPYWWKSGAGNVAQVGQCYQASGKCNGIGEARAYFQFDTRVVAGKRIIQTDLLADVTYSPNCEARNHELYVVPGAQIHPEMTWATAPGGGRISTASAAGVWTNCPGRKGVDFRFSAGHEADGIGMISSFFLKAANSSDQLAWRKYDPATARLTITFNTAPRTPEIVATDPPTPAPCTWCAGRSFVGDPSIRLRTRLSDSDGDQLRAKWRIKFDGVETAWDGPAPLNSGSVHSAPVNLDDKHGKSVQWWVHGHDGVDLSPHGWGRTFVVDRQPPAQAPTVASVEYPEDNRWHGGVGVRGTFRFTANGVGDVDHYLYGWSSPPSTKVDAVGGLGGAASVGLVPPGDGPRTLYVQSVDRAGHRSPTEEHRFYVRAGNGALSQWSFDGNAADTAFLGDRHGTLNGTSTYVPGAVSNAIQFDGNGDMTAANGVDTRASFTVSAWLRIDPAVPPLTYTAVSLAGTTSSAVQLGYGPDGDGNRRWFFSLPQADSAAAEVDTAWSDGTAQPGWTHLTGVYDAETDEARLFVDGDPVGVTAHTAGWKATGQARVGSALSNGVVSNHWVGAIDEVRLYDRALSDREILSAVSGDNVQVAHWRFEGDTGLTARNSVESGPMAVLTEDNASFEERSEDNGVLRLDGGYAETSEPLIRTDQDFSVTASVELDADLPDGSYAILSQDGDTISGFSVRYEQLGADRRWVFTMPRSDQDPSAGYDTVSMPATPTAGDPTHLTAVYDDDALRLFVDGDNADATPLPRTSSWNAAGAFAIGRELAAGAPAHALSGAIDDVRVYSRALSTGEISGIVAGDGTPAGLWRLDGNATDSSGGGKHGVLHGGPEWAAGQTSSPDPTDLAVKLNGTDQYVTVEHPVSTRSSFSVSAWVRLDQVGGTATVVSKDGVNRGGFYLQAQADGSWTFALPQSDDLSADTDSVSSPASATQVGVWTHLVGVFNGSQQQLALYLNGELVDSASHGLTFDATGSLSIGRSLLSPGVHGNFFPGAIDDVNVHDRALFASEIRAMAGRDLSLVHNWRFDETGGTAAADSVGVRGGTLVGGASFGPGRVSNSVELNGTDAAVTTTGVDLSTDQSFTVSAWVRFDPDVQCELGEVNRCMSTAVSVDGAQTSKFRLGHVVDSELARRGRWVFEMPGADSAGDAPLDQAALDVTAAEVDEWVHLVGVYDAQTEKTWLYVNGDRMDDGTLSTAWAATGGLQIGRGKVSGAAAQYWAGGIDDVRLYTGVQDLDRVNALYRSYPAALPATLPTPDAGHWKFDEGSGVTVADTSANGLAMTTHGGDWQPGRSSWAGSFDGVGAYAETTGPAVDTARSFSVAAWASPTATTGVGTILGQDGSQDSTFAVQYRAGDARWTVRVPTDTGEVTLTSTEAVAARQWTHLALTYDATADDPAYHSLRLYVNGSVSAVQVGVGVRGSTGPLSVGRARWAGANADFFGGGVDDVRAFGKSLSEAEIRTIYDDVRLSVHGYWRFDGTGTDNSWRQNPTTMSGSPSFVAGVNDRALRLDGTAVAATAQKFGVPTTGSFTVSAWAKLARTDQVQTVLSEDGTRMSGYVLQYRPELNRWVFGAPAQDADGAVLVHATSAQAPTPKSWTHLTGVYDRPARQLRLYVDGQLAGKRDNVLLWQATGGFAIGRAKVDGEPTDFFAGDLDEVTADMGAAADSEIARRATYPVAASGQLGRFVNGRGDHYTASTDDPVRPGYHFEATLGGLLPDNAADTTMLYSCAYGADLFTSASSNCEGKVVLGEIGLVYAAPPASPQTVPLYRCNTGADHFESLDATCGGANQEAVLGYTVGYAPLSRYNNPVGWDHAASVNGTPPGYYREGSLGSVSLVAVPGGHELFSCRDGIDRFLSTDAGCEGETVVSSVGWIWAEAPDGVPSAPLYRCLLSQERFESMSATCERQTVDSQLGYVVTETPGLPPTEPTATISSSAKAPPPAPDSSAGTRPPFPTVVGWAFSPGEN